MQSLPVTPWQVLQAKLEVQLILTGLPVLFCSLCIALIYPYSGVQMLLTLLLLLLYVLFSALLGLFIGLKMPNLVWTNEITPIKQNTGVMLALLNGSLYAVILFIGYVIVGYPLGFSGYLLCFIAVTLALVVVLYRWLKKKGGQVFAAL